jgi:hypothetical protein
MGLTLQVSKKGRLYFCDSTPTIKSSLGDTLTRIFPLLSLLCCFEVVASLYSSLPSIRRFPLFVASLYSSLPSSFFYVLDALCSPPHSVLSLKGDYWLGLYLLDILCIDIIAYCYMFLDRYFIWAGHVARFTDNRWTNSICTAMVP